MNPADREKTTFITDRANFVDPSGVQALKNPKPFEGC